MWDVGEQRACLVLGREGAEQAGGEARRDLLRVGVERLPLREGAVGARQRAHRQRGRRIVACDEEAGVASVAVRRRVRGDLARAKIEIEVKLGDQLARHQRDEVGVARDTHVDALEGALGDGGAAGLVEALEDEHAAAGEAEVGGGGEAVVASPDDHGVVGHGGTVSARRCVCAPDIPARRSRSDGNGSSAFPKGSMSVPLAPVPVGTPAVRDDYTCWRPEDVRNRGTLRQDP